MAKCSRIRKLIVNQNFSTYFPDIAKRISRGIQVKCNFQILYELEMIYETS